MNIKIGDKVKITDARTKSRVGLEYTEVIGASRLCKETQTFICDVLGADRKKWTIDVEATKKVDEKETDRW